MDFSVKKKKKNQLEFLFIGKYTYRVPMIVALAVKEIDRFLEYLLQIFFLKICYHRKAEAWV